MVGRWSGFLFVSSPGGKFPAMFVEGQPLEVADVRSCAPTHQLISASVLVSSDSLIFSWSLGYLRLCYLGLSCLRNGALSGYLKKKGSTPWVWPTTVGWSETSPGLWTWSIPLPHGPAVGWKWFVFFCRFSDQTWRLLAMLRTSLRNRVESYHSWLVWFVSMKLKSFYQKFVEEDLSHHLSYT